METLESLKGTRLWPHPDQWRGCILFLETSEAKPKPDYVRWWLRNYAEQGILHNVQGILLGRPCDNTYVQEYETALLTVLEEEGLTDLPVITQMDFGHSCPVFTLPYGVLAEIDCASRTFRLLESGVEA